MKQPDLNLFRKFKEFIEVFMESLAVQAPKTEPRQKWDQHRKMVLENSYHLNSKRYTRKELSFLFSLSEGRVRQINKETIAAISDRIKEVNPDIFTLYYLEDLKKLDSYLRREKVWPKSRFYTYLAENHQIDIELEKPYISLMIDVLGYRIVKNYYSQLEDNDLIFFEETIDRELFFKICRETFIVLEDNVFPTSPEMIRSVVKNNLNQPSINNDLIDSTLNVIEDLEVVIRNDTKFYQIAFHRLSSASDMAYRILFENGNWMKLSDIDHEINHRLSLKNKKSINQKSIRTGMKSNPHLLPLGKTGIWTLKEWENENLILSEHITNILLQFGKPLTKKDIFSHLLNIQPFMRHNSFNSVICNSRFVQLRDKKIILSEWKDIFQKKAVVNRKRNKN